MSLLTNRYLGNDATVKTKQTSGLKVENFLRGSRVFLREEVLGRELSLFVRAGAYDLRDRLVEHRTAVLFRYAQNVVSIAGTNYIAASHKHESPQQVGYAGRWPQSSTAGAITRAGQATRSQILGMIKVRQRTWQVHLRSESLAMRSRHPVRVSSCPSGQSLSAIQSQWALVSGSPTRAGR